MLYLLGASIAGPIIAALGIATASLFSAGAAVFIAIRRSTRVEERSLAKDEYEGIIDRLNTEVERQGKDIITLRASHEDCMTAHREDQGRIAILERVLRAYNIEVPAI